LQEAQRKREQELADQRRQQLENQRRAEQKQREIERERAKIEENRRKQQEIEVCKIFASFNQSLEITFHSFILLETISIGEKQTLRKGPF